MLTMINMPEFYIKNKYDKDPVRVGYDNLTGQKTYARMGKNEGIYEKPYMNNPIKYGVQPDYLRSPKIPEINIKSIYKKLESP